MGSNLRDDYFLSTGPHNSFALYIEGLTPGQVELALEFHRGAATGQDKVRLNVVEYGVVEIRYKTFIACNVVSTGWNPGEYDIFSGDERTFGYTLGTSRSFQSYRVSVNPVWVDRELMDGVAGNQEFFGPSAAYNESAATVHVCGPGDAPQVCPGFCTICLNPLATADCASTATDGVGGNVMRALYQRVDESRVDVDFDLVAKVPCSALSFAPGIDVNMIFEFRQAYNPVTGFLTPMEWRLKPGMNHGHDGFPWHELYLNGVEVYRFDPCIGPGIPGKTWSGPNPNSLFGDDDILILDRPAYTALDDWQSVPGQ